MPIQQIDRIISPFQRGCITCVGGRRNMTLLAEDIYIIGYSVVSKLEDRRLKKLVKFQHSNTLDMSHLSENQDEVIDIKELMLLCMDLKSEVAHIKEKTRHYVRGSVSWRISCLVKKQLIVAQRFTHRHQNLLKLRTP